MRTLRIAAKKAEKIAALGAAVAALLFTALFLAAAPARAGGFLDAAAMIDGPSPFPGYFLAESVPIFHDVRCIPAIYRLNTTLDPLPNPLGAPFLSLAAAQQALAASLASWNDIPTSFIELRLEGTTTNPGFFQTFDTVNEVHFKAPPFLRSTIAASPSISLAADLSLAAGTDLDGDGDSDVAAGIATCDDVDADGDREWPEGFYKAGTILDNDVYFNTNGVRFTVDPAAADTHAMSIDLEGVATHEFGHSLGLAHSEVNLLSAEDGTLATMYPFADTSDPVNELAMRTPEEDDVSYASLAYPEGTASSGPSALQLGDIAFDAVYGRISGEVTHGVLGVPVAGASVSAVDRRSGRTVAATYSGTTTRFYNDPLTFDIILLPGYDSVVDGRYTLPVKKGLYDVRLEAMDDFPVPGFVVSYPGWVGYLLGMLDFGEEAWNGFLESDVELAPDQAFPLLVRAGRQVSGVDFTTNKTTAVGNFGSFNTVRYQDALPGTYYAVRVPGEQVLDAAGGDHFALLAAEFFTYVLDNSVVPRFAEAMITTGRALPDGTAEVDLAHPLARERPFVAQELDFAPSYVRFPLAVGLLVEHRIRVGEIDSLFLVLRLPTESPFPGPTAVPPVIGVDGPAGFNDVPIYGLSYRSTDGVTFIQDNDWNYQFRLVITPLGGGS